MLGDEEIKNRFQLTLSNKYEVLAGLHEEEEHQDEEVNQVWQKVNCAWKETCEETQEIQTAQDICKEQGQQKQKPKLDIRRDKIQFTEELAC